MAEQPAITLRRTAPEALETVRPDLSFRLETDLGVAKLRIVGKDADARFQAVTGMVPPPSGRLVADQGLSVAWLAPGEWLVTGPEVAVAAWVARIGGQTAGDLLAVDLTHARASFCLAGTAARAALAAHCPLDLWPDSFPVDAVARSLLGDAGMFIARLSDGPHMPRFRIIVDQTMAPYAGRLFARVQPRAGVFP
ncbi:sarcosine oxidase subunit gamma [Niveispirillum fermenti]|uniref:sarcosine oxidase subunit gamma n=1 Tax=Niveispirillum fermenti TaxID=1233113 RepID=UPI003A85290C